MAHDEFKPVEKPRPKGKASIWFVDGRLFQQIFVDPVSDRVLVYDYTDKEKKTFAFSDFRRKRERAYTLREVAGLVGRRYDYCHKLKQDGMLDAYGVSVYPMNGEGARQHHYYDKQDVIRIHDFFARRGRGPRRKNGTWMVPKGMTTRDDLMAALNEEQVRYIKRDGKFIPVYKEV